MLQGLVKWFVAWVGETVREVDDRVINQCDEERRAAGRRAGWVLFTAAVVLTLQHYVFSSTLLWEWFGWAGADAESIGWYRLCMWAAGQMFCYMVIPVLMMKLVIGMGVRECGLKIRGCMKSAWIYLGMYGVMAPALFYFSTWGGFLETYPFYRVGEGEALWPRFWVWEFLYWGQFVALEFFFRGFMLHGVKGRFGFYSIYVMMVPYCMIHFGKPLPETFGAIGAGVILGFMSLRTNSIWWGAALHIGVAVTMDLLALWRMGTL